MKFFVWRDCKRDVKYRQEASREIRSYTTCTRGCGRRTALPTSSSLEPTAKTFSSSRREDKLCLRRRNGEASRRSRSGCSADERIHRGRHCGVNFRWRPGNREAGEWLHDSVGRTHPNHVYEIKHRRKWQQAECHHFGKGTCRFSFRPRTRK